MSDREKIVEGLEDVQVMLTKAVDRGGEMAVMSAFNCLNNVTRAIALLKEQKTVVRCSECENWVPGYITDRDDFIPPKCGEYQQMVGHSADDYCSLGKRQEGR